MQDKVTRITKKADELDLRRQDQVKNQIYVINRLLRRLDLLAEFLEGKGQRAEAEKFIESQIEGQYTERLHIGEDGTIRMYNREGKPVWPPAD